jgi:hypothetical protein
MRIHAFARALFLLLALSGAALADSAATPWEKFDEADGISVFRKEMPGTPIIGLRGEGVVDAPIVSVASVLVDTKRSPEWIDSVADARVVRRLSETEFVEYSHVKTPFVLADRDFVYRVKVELVPAKKQVIVSFRSVEDPAAPRNPDYVRGHFIYGKWVLTSLDHGKKTRVLAELLCDPKGSVAKWIVNLFQKSWPHDTLANLRKRMKRTDLKDEPRIKEALKSHGFD